MLEKVQINERSYKDKFALILKSMT